MADDITKTINLKIKAQKDTSVDKVAADVKKIQAGHVTGPVAKKLKDNRNNSVKDTRMLLGFEKARTKELKEQAKVLKQQHAEQAKQVNTLVKANKQLQKSLEDGGGGGGGKGGRKGSTGAGGAGNRGFVRQAAQSAGLGRFMAGGLTGAATAAVVAAVASGIGQIYSGVEQFKGVRMQDASLSALGLSTKDVEAIRSQGAKLGYGQEATTGLITPTARATGSVRDVAAVQRMERRGVGLSAEDAMGFMGVLRRGGNKDFLSGRGKREFEKSIAAAFSSGLEKERFPEFFQGVAELVTRGGEFTTKDVGAEAASSLLSMLSRSGLSGLQGTRGAEVLSAIDQSIRAPKGEGQQAFIMRAFGFGKPGGSESFWEASKRMDMGVTDEKMGVKNFFDLFKEARQETGGGQMMYEAIHQLTGLSRTSSEDISKLAERAMSPEGQKEMARIQADIKKVLEDSKPIDEKINDNLKDIAKVAGDSAKRQEDLYKKGGEAYEAIHSLGENIFQLIGTIADKLIPVIKELARVIDEALKYWKGTNVSTSTTMGSIPTLTGDQLKDVWNAPTNPEFLKKKHAGRQPLPQLTNAPPTTVTLDNVSTEHLKSITTRLHTMAKNQESALRHVGNLAARNNGAGASTHTNMSDFKH